MTVIDKISNQGCGCDRADGQTSLISIDEAIQTISGRTLMVRDTVDLPLEAALGRVLAEPVRAQIMVPSFDNSAMDGYAVDADAFEGEGPWFFDIASRIPAGVTETPVLQPGQAARIFTGAPVPPGANAVVMQEATQRSGDKVEVFAKPRIGLNIRRLGEDMTRNTIVLRSGTHLGPTELAVCAASGNHTVAVRQKLRIGLLVSGNEISASGSDRKSGQIWDVNTPLLLGEIARHASCTVEAFQVPDNPSLLRETLGRLRNSCDLIVTTGGISVGEEDHILPVLRELGATIHFSGVALKPGKPVSFGVIGRTFWLGLPGNPVSSFVTWKVFGTHLLSTLLGETVKPIRRHVVLGEDLKHTLGRCELRPAHIDGFDSTGREVAGFQSATHSGRVASLPKSDGLIFIPAEVDCLPEGAIVEFLPF